MMGAMGAPMISSMPRKRGSRKSLSMNTTTCLWSLLWAIRPSLSQTCSEEI
jgi:hypothetical protein